MNPKIWFLPQKITLVFVCRVKVTTNLKTAAMIVTDHLGHRTYDPVSTHVLILLLYLALLKKFIPFSTMTTL
jgi:hypothetical protein